MSNFATMDMNGDVPILQQAQGCGQPEISRTARTACTGMSAAGAIRWKALHGFQTHQCEGTSSEKVCIRLQRQALDIRTRHLAPDGRPPATSTASRCVVGRGLVEETHRTGRVRQRRQAGAMWRGDQSASHAFRKSGACSAAGALNTQSSQCTVLSTQLAILAATPVVTGVALFLVMRFLA